MTIYKDISDTRRMNLEWMATSQDVVTVKAPEEVVTDAFCVCKFECDYIEFAFGNQDNGANEFKNDKTNLLVKLTLASDTVDFTLVNLINGQEFDLTTGTYGTYYANGWTATNPLYTGVEIEWNKVLTLVGSGLYQIKITQNSIGQDYVTTTHKYHVLPYSDESANNTIRIKATHSGYFNNGLDYTDLNWVSYIRIPAKVTGKTPVEDKSEYVALRGESRQTEQIQERTITEWSVLTNLLPSVVYNGLIYDKLKANKIELSDYALFAKEKLRNLVVKYDGVEGVEWHSDNTKATWTFKFTETDIKIKRNFR